MKELNRRTVLRGLLGGAVASVGLPLFERFLDSGGAALAAGGALPTRFGVWWWGNGMNPARWTPATTGLGWQPTEQLAPLERHRDLVTVITNMSVQVPNVAPHGSGPAGLLSGIPLPDTNEYGTFQGPSIDQMIARGIGDETRFRSLETGVRPGPGLSHNAPHSRNPPERSPHALFERVFGVGFTAPGEEPIIDPTVAIRRSVLDAVMQDAADVERLLGAADRARLDQHLTGIRELELRLARLEADPPNLAACSGPGAPAADIPDIEGRPQMKAINRAMAELLAMAFACDQTRVFFHEFSRPVSDILYPGANAGHHQLTHDEPLPQPGVHDIVVYIMEALAEFIDVLRGIPEGDGTLLDNMVLLASSEVSLGQTHAIDEIPLLLAGGACGRLKTGLHYRPGSAENASAVMLSLVRAMGVGAADYGVDDARATDGLGAIEA